MRKQVSKNNVLRMVSVTSKAGLCCDELWTYPLCWNSPARSLFDCCLHFSLFEAKIVLSSRQSKLSAVERSSSRDPQYLRPKCGADPESGKLGATTLGCGFSFKGYDVHKNQANCAWDMRSAPPPQHTHLWVRPCDSEMFVQVQRSHFSAAG